jgi:hypothetical protein
MTRHRAYRKPPVKPTGEWMRLSHHLTLQIDEIADRDDLIVKIAPDAGFDDSAYHNGQLILNENGEPAKRQHPGVTFTNGIIEINANYLDENITPQSMHPENREDRERYPVLWGIVTHEAAHAHYTRWLTEIDHRASKGEITDEQTHHIGAAVLLEETRIEAKHLKFRPQDQLWLQASGTKIAQEEISRQIQAHQQENPDTPIPKHAVGRAAALILARVDAGTITPDDNTLIVQKLVNDTFGDDAQTLKRIWLDTQQTNDNDTSRMLALGKEWYELTGDDGDDIDILILCPADGESDLEKALRRAADNAVKEASGETSRERRRVRLAKITRDRTRETKAAADAQRQAHQVFAGSGNSQAGPVTGHRPPTPQETSLARTTKRLLEAVYTPDRAVTSITRPLPPGRLSTRTLMKHNTQRNLGFTPTAEPFTYKDRLHVPTPPLKVGIVQDVSSSQRSAAAAAVSGAWSLARAASWIADATVAMVSFGDAVHPIINPHRPLGGVPVLRTPYGTQHFTEAVQAVEGELSLTLPGSARLLVILTDGEFSSYDLNHRDESLRRLAKAGVKILWMVTSGGYHIPERIPGVHVFTGTAGQFDIIPKVINTEAVKALKK